MAQKGEEAASKFINALIKSLQTLCHGYLEFQNGIEIIGHINLSVDKGGSLDYILKEKVCKNAENSTLFISNSFHAEAKPEEIAQRRQSQSEGTQCVGPNASMHQSERDGSRFLGSLPDGSAAFTSGSFDHGQQFSAGDGGSNTSQPGPSGMRGVSGIQSFVNSLSAFGSLGAPGLPLSQIGASAGASRQNRVGGLPKTSGSNQQPGSGSYSKSHTSLQRAFALHREDKRKRQEGLTSEEDMKQRLELMSELLSLKGVSSTEDYKTALLREKRRLAKKLYRASLPEEKKIEIKEKDKLHKRMKRATRWAATASMTDPSQHFSDCSSDITSQKEFDDIPRTSSGFTGSFAAVGSVSVEGMHDKDQGTSGNASRHSCDSPRIPPRPGSGPGSEENLHSLGSESLPCDSGMGSGSGGGIPRLGPSCLGNIPRICSTSSSHIGVGTDPLESFATTRPGAVSSASMVFGSVGSVPWMDPVSFDTSSQGHRPMDHDGSQREGYNLMKLGQR